jgi:hypothetical protein
LDLTFKTKTQKTIKIAIFKLDSLTIGLKKTSQYEYQNSPEDVRKWRSKITSHVTAAELTREEIYLATEELVNNMTNIQFHTQFE